MKAVTFQEVGVMAVSDVPDPTIEQPGDAIVKISCCAICGSDLHLLHGDIPLTPGYICGHEFTGTIEETGSGVSGFKTGDHVVGAFHIACGTCGECRRGNQHLCRRGGVLGYGPMTGNLPGTQAEYAKISFADNNLRKIPEGMDEEKALFCGDVLTTAYGAVVNGQLEPGESVAVIGCGPVGIMAIQSAQALGAGDVYALDLLPDRRKLAESFGAIPVDAGDNPAGAIRDLTRKRGVDVVIEAVGGNHGTIELAFQLVAGGGRISAVGVTNQPTFEYPLLLGLGKDLTFRIGLANIHRDFDATMELVRSGRIDPLPVVSHRMALDEAVKGYQMADQRQATKILLKPS